MRLSSSKLAWLLSFLTGLFWAMVIIGFFRGLFSNWHIGFFYALASAFFWMIPGVLGVVFVEYLINGFERTEAIKEQNKLLKELLESKQ
jgi:hypothetical protein